MNDFSFYSPTRIMFGRKMADHVGEHVAAAGYTSALLVYGTGSVVRTGTLERVKASLDAAGVAHVELGGVRPNPEISSVREGLRIAREANVDLILPVGGGSAIDCAKAIALGIPYDGDVWDFFRKRAAPAQRVDVACVLTLPASGSEASNSCVISNDAEHLKCGCNTDLNRPVMAFMDPELTFTLPPYQTAAGITDMCAHIMERFFSGQPAVPVTDNIACGLIRAIVDAAPRVMEDPQDYDARANIMWAGTLAHNGVCGVGRKEDWASHGLEHELSALYGVTHGAGLAVVFPAWMEYMAANRPAKIAQYARRVFGVTEADDFGAALEGVRRLRLFFREIGLPTNLKELGVEHPDFDTLVARFHENKGIPAGSYYPLYPDDTRAIYELMVKGRC